VTVTKRTRFEVMTRDNHTCRYCGATAPDAKLTIDHVVPVALGGGDDPSNLVAACRDCNAGKSSTTPGQALVADVSAVNVAFAEAMRQASEELFTESAEDQAYLKAFEAAWDRQTWGDNMPITWRDSILRFKASGLPVDVLITGIGRAVAAPSVTRSERFRYMCGFAWKKVGELRDRAAELMAEPEEPTTAADWERGYHDGHVARLQIVRAFVVGEDPDDAWEPTTDPAVMTVVGA